MPDEIENPVTEEEEHHLTPEEEAEYERKRQEEWDALIRPYKELAQAMHDRDELLADILFEMTLNELEG